MQIQTDQLGHFLEKHEVSKTAFRICGIIFALNYLLSITTFFYSLKVSKIDFETLLTYKLILLQLFFVRVVPLVGLGLYLLQKKTGWVLLIIYSLTNLLGKSEFVINFIGNNKITSTVDPLLSIPIILMFIFSLTIFFLLLAKSIKELLNISIWVRVISILAAIAIYIFIKYYFGDFLISQMKAN